MPRPAARWSTPCCAPREDKSVHVIVLTGAGRAFCAGGDLDRIRDARNRRAVGELQSHARRRQGNLPRHRDDAEACGGGRERPRRRSGDEHCARVRSAHRLGAGYVLAVVCAGRAFIPDFGATFFLPRLVGLSRASELFYTAERLSAQEALRIGILYGVFPSDQFEARSRKAGPEPGRRSSDRLS